MIAVDIEGSTTRNNYDTAVLRNDLYEIFEAALEACGITKDLLDEYTDRGDGLIAYVHPVNQVPKTMVVSTFVPALHKLLRKHAADHPTREFRLRVAVHAGDAHFDPRGAFGEDVNITARLVDAQEVKDALRQTSEPLVLVVSDYIHRSVVRQGYDGIDETTFKPLVELDVGGQAYRGWVQLPGEAQTIGKTIPLIDRAYSRARSAGRSASLAAGRAQVARLRRRTGITTGRVMESLPKKDSSGDDSTEPTPSLRSG
ncbi:MAG: hypothetical protein GEV28_28045 [Actinophytocola sp.]|uniref:hypothetical protein n=1 Tax=Actinophytocola sp. TaxID=1872138 RepID=UPI00132ACD88|nr:hypothetical protein [Actinophytocola sp.]MPZ84038.1 hypothetical protein [Actinophytocola sp.]